jgi:hypothetical protein
VLNGDFNLADTSINPNTVTNYLGLVRTVKTFGGETNIAYVPIKSWQTSGGGPDSYPVWGAKVSSNVAADWAFVAQPQGASPSMIYFGA